MHSTGRYNRNAQLSDRAKKTQQILNSKNTSIVLYQRKEGLPTVDSLKQKDLRNNKIIASIMCAVFVVLLCITVPVVHVTQNSIDSASGDFTSDVAHIAADKADSALTGLGDPNHITWRIQQEGVWLENEQIGKPNHPITGIAIDFQGRGWYQVCTEEHGWLPVVTGYNIDEEIKGFAGYRLSPITAVRIGYESENNTENMLSAKYRISEINKDGWSNWQFDNERLSGDNDHAGQYAPIDQFELTIG